MIEEEIKKEKEEIVSEWISDVNVRIEASKRFGNKENNNDIKDEIEKQLREEAKRLQEFINNREKTAQ